MSGAPDAPREPRESLEPLAWAALVARWAAVAKASRALAKVDPRLADSIAPLIAVEANTAALGELHALDPADRPHARAVAEVAIRHAATELDALWTDEVWPDEIAAAFEAAERALRLAPYAGLAELVVSGDGPLEVPDLGLAFDPADHATHAGILAAMAPGTIAMPGEPVAWWTARPAPLASATPELLGLSMRSPAEPRQVYRAIDDRGRFVDDTVASVEGEVLAGLPLVVPLAFDGRAIGRFLRAPDEWAAMQRAALDGRGSLPVRFV